MIPELRVKATLVVIVLAMTSQALAQSANYPVVLFTGSNNFRTDQDYRFSVSSNRLRSNLVANFTLLSNSSQSLKAESVLLNQLISSNSLRSFRFPTKALSSNIIELTLQIDVFDSIEQASYKEMIPLKLVERFSSYIYFDKAFYGKQDTVKFTIFSIDADTKPYNPKFSVINVLDQKNQIMKTFSNVLFVQGKYKGSYKLNDTFYEGLHSLSFKAESQSPISKMYEVKDFNLIQSSQLLEVEKTFGYDGTFQVKVIPTYTFGEIIEGIAEVSIWTLDRYYVPASWRRKRSLRTKRSFPPRYEVRKTMSYSKTVTVEKSAASFEVDFRSTFDNYDVTDKQIVKMIVKFTDSDTGKIMEKEDIFVVEQSPYEIITIGSDFFVPNEPYDLKVFLRRIGEGKPAPAGIAVSVDFFKYSCDFDCSQSEFYSYTGETDEMGSFSLKHSPTDFNTLYIEVISPDIKFYVRSVHRMKNFELDAVLLTQEPKIGLPVKIEVKTTLASVTRCSCHMISKGILVSTLDLRFRNKTATVTFTPSLAHTPKTEVIFFAVGSNGNLVSKQITISFSEPLKNYVDLKLTENVVEPGKKVTLKVSSLKFSTVSIFAQDATSKLLGSGNDFSKVDVVNNILKQYNTTNEENWNAKEIQKFERIKIFAKAIQIRSQNSANVTAIEMGNETEYLRNWVKKFPPNWFEGSRRKFMGELQINRYSWSIVDSSEVIVRSSDPSFEEIVIKDVLVLNETYPGSNSSDAEAFVTFKAPNAISNYVFSAVSMNYVHGLGMTAESSTLKVFLDFFIQLFMPYQCKRNQVVFLNITAFSYLPTNQTVTISFAKNDKEFEVLKPEFDGWNDDTTRYWRTFTSVPKKFNNFRIAIRPKVHGSIKLNFDAVGDVASDKIEKQLKVIPEGYLRSISQHVVILKDELTSSSSSSLQCVLPYNAGNGTTSTVVSVSGNLLSHNVDQLGYMLQSGTRYNMRTIDTAWIFIQSVLSLRYLDSIKQVDDAKKTEMKLVNQNSYEFLLKTRNSDGSFSFDSNDQVGSSWMTALMVEASEIAQPEIQVNLTIVREAFDFLIATQNFNGSFREEANIGNSLNAFISIVMSKSLHRFPEFTDARNKALDFIVNNANKSDVYEICICTLALHLGKHASFKEFYDEMMLKGVETNDQLKWEYSSASAYALQVLKDIDIEKAAKVATYLTANRYSYSYQELIALADLESSWKAKVGKLDLRIISKMRNNVKARVDSNNSLIVQEFNLHPLARQLNITSLNGTGLAVVRLTCNYYEVAVGTNPRFKIRVYPSRVCDGSLWLPICITANTEVDEIKSSLYVMKLTPPSGFVFNNVSQSIYGAPLVETSNGDTTVVAYFDGFAPSLSSRSSCFSIRAVQQSIVQGLQNSTVEVTEIYTGKSSQTFYSTPETLPSYCVTPSPSPSSSNDGPSWNLFN